MPGIEVFVSYSRHDQAIVVPVVQLLRLGEHDLVFLDVDGIRPGERWRERLEAALQAAQYIVLFWCEHAARSDEVAREYEAALAGGKSVVPVLLDRTPLPPALAAFQWIDFTALRVADHGRAATPVPVAPPAPVAAPTAGRDAAGMPPGGFDPFAPPDIDAPVLRPPIVPAPSRSPGDGAPVSAAPHVAGPLQAMADRIRDELVRRARSPRP